MDRVYFPYDKWEDYNLGMYQKTCYMDEQSLITECETLLACPEWLSETMGFIVSSWKYSTQQNLTNTNRNRQAWLGQASCILIHGAPEYITKLAWNNLTIDQQSVANKIADDKISLFEEYYKNGFYK